jgi:hypothetical protein
MPKLFAFSLAALVVGMILNRVFDRIKPNRKRGSTLWESPEPPTDECAMTDQNGGKARS